LRKAAGGGRADSGRSKVEEVEFFLSSKNLGSNGEGRILGGRKKGIGYFQETSKDWERETAQKNGGGEGVRDKKKKKSLVLLREWPFMEGGGRFI